jgi:hypothetical protein
MIGWWMQRRNVVKIHSRGVTYKTWSAEWAHITAVERSASGLIFTNSKNVSATVPNSINGLDSIEAVVRAKAGLA